MGEPTRCHFLVSGGHCLALCPFRGILGTSPESPCGKRLTSQCPLTLRMQGFAECYYTTSDATVPAMASDRPSLSNPEPSGCRGAWLVLVTHSLLPHQYLFVKCFCLDFTHRRCGDEKSLRGSVAESSFLFVSCLNTWCF